MRDDRSPPYSVAVLIKGNSITSPRAILGPFLAYFE
jgi:hypothetical protein